MLFKCTAAGALLRWFGFFGQQACEMRLVSLFEPSITHIRFTRDACPNYHPINKGLFNWTKLLFRWNGHSMHPSDTYEFSFKIDILHLWIRKTIITSAGSSWFSSSCISTRILAFDIGRHWFLGTISAEGGQTAKKNIFDPSCSLQLKEANGHDTAVLDTSHDKNYLSIEIKPNGNPSFSYAKTSTWEEW